VKWIGGLATWKDDATRTAFLSIAFTWKLPEARQWGDYYRSIGYRVVAGGPAMFLARMGAFLAPHVDEIPTVWRMIDGRLKQVPASKDDSVVRHNPYATTASRGCDQACSFCIVTPMEGSEFTLLPDFPVRPVLTDNNLSGLPVDYQRHIIEKYQHAEIPLVDANSGFEPHSFDEDCYQRWLPINRGPWRFAFDEMREREAVERVFAMLATKDLPSKRKRVYVLIGNEPFEACMERIAEVVAWGGEPHVQPYMKLNALKKRPHPRFDWTEQKLIDVARWANGFAYKKVPFGEWNRSQKRDVPARVRARDGLLL
jgi:hypothetical protein